MAKDPSRVRHFLVRWGVALTPALRPAENFTCPHCMEFSFFCNGDFNRPAALLWRQATVGFSPGGHHELVGVAILECKCGEHFTVPLSEESLAAYALDCALWPK